MMLPLDICLEILLRLPVESLFRCRAVCKRWCTVIDEPNFARAHTNNMSHLSSQTVVIRNVLGPPVDPLWTFDLDAISFIDGLQELSGSSLHLTDNELEALQNPFPLCECNGLILVETLPGLEIWNLSTRERLQLPQGDYPLGKQNIGLGLGYDNAAHDFKTVVIHRHQTHVYSLRSDSWRDIGVCPFQWDSRDEEGFFLCGALNWVSSFYNKIIALDLGTEKYREIQMPIKRNMFDEKYPYVLSGCLFLSGFRNPLLVHFDVWVMMDYGAGDSWIKFFSIRNDLMNDNFLRPIAFMKDRNQVFLIDGGSGFVLFDVESNSMKRAHINGPTGKLSAQNIPRSLYRIHDHCGSSGRSRIRRLYRPMKMKASMTIQRLKIDEEVSTLAERVGRVSLQRLLSGDVYPAAL